MSTEPSRVHMTPLSSCIPREALKRAAGTIIYNGVRWCKVRGPWGKVDMRMNLKSKKVELKTTDKTEDEGALQKSADFVQAFLLGFEVG